MTVKKLVNGTTRRFLRDVEIRRMKARLESDRFPRIEMAVIVALTGGAGFLASFILLRLGVESMALRYPLALMVAYLFFLLFLWLWMKQALDVDIVNLDGGGGSGWHGARCGSSGDAIDIGNGLDADLGDAWIPVAVVLLVLALALSSLWIIYTAPVLFAELLVDGVIAVRLYKRLGSIEGKHWLRSAISRTAWPLLATAMALAAAGLTMDSYVPGANSIGGVLAAISAS